MTRRAALITSKVAVTILVVAVLIGRLDLGEVAGLLVGVRPGPLVMAVALLAGSHMVVALVWRYLLEGVGVATSMERAIRLYYAGLFLNNFFLGSVGGDSYRVYGLYREIGTGRAALAATLLERIVGLVALFLLGVAAIAFRYQTLPAAYRMLLLFLTGGGALLGLAIILTPGLVKTLAKPVLRLTGGRLRERIEGVLDAMRRGGRPGPIAVAVAVTLAAQGIRIWTHWWCASALGIQVAVADVFVAIPLVAVVAGLPISVGGLGVREGSGVLLLAPIGIAEPAAVAMEFLAYLVGVTTSLIGGFAFLLGREVPPSRVEDLNSATRSRESSP
jgi:uncharacterized protein (TIRG00374 family)